MISTRHGNTSRVDASIDLNETSITTYSSTFVIDTNNDEISEYGVEIISNGTNKGIILGTENYSTFVEIKNNGIKSELGNVKIEMLPNLIELQNTYSKSGYTATGFYTEVTSENEGKSNIQIAKNHVYLTTYNNSNIILGALNLENNKAEVCFGSNKITVSNSIIKSEFNDTSNNRSSTISLGNNIIKSEVTDTDGNSTIVLRRTYTNNSESNIILSHAQGIKLEQANNTYSSNIQIKEKLITLRSDGDISLSNNKGFLRINEVRDENNQNSLLKDILSIGIEDSGAYSSKLTIEHIYDSTPNNDSRVIELSAGRSSTVSTLLSKTNITLNNSVFYLSSKEEYSGNNIVENFIFVNEDSSLRYTSIGINEIDSEQNQSTRVKLVLSNNSTPTQPALFDNCLVSRKFTVVIDNITYYIPIILQNY